MAVKIDKKILVVLIVVLVIIIFIGVLIHRHLTTGPVEIENSVGGLDTESLEGQNILPVQIEAEVQPSNEENKGAISVCRYECGDGACQKLDPYCDNGLNCICPETPQDCPEDCQE